MKFLKWFGVVAAVYIVFVILFETVFLGMYQPKLENSPYQMLVLTTIDGSGDSQSRRLARFETDKKLYVSAHHWPRGWYKRALKNPNVQVEIDGAKSDYIAVPVADEEVERVAAKYPLGLVTRFLMGFPPPRDVLRLDPAMGDESQG
jgi:hypothetical protein